MIRRIQVLNYRCLRHVDVYLDGWFHILVGPNSSGKSTFLDVVGFLSDLATGGLGAALKSRTANFGDLVWNRQRLGSGFELALELEIPKLLGDSLREERQESRIFGLFRYEVAIRLGDDGPYIASEAGLFKSIQTIKQEEKGKSGKTSVFSTPSDILPSEKPTPTSILSDSNGSDHRCIFRKSADGTTTYNFELASQREALPLQRLVVDLEPRSSALRNLIEDRRLFPVTNRAKRLLQKSVQNLFLHSTGLRQASPFDHGRIGLVSDGSNLPWAIKRLQENDPSRFKEWLGHVRTGLREVEDILIIEREDNQHAHLMLCHTTGVRVPSWTLSDGTLRLLALTLAAYLPSDGMIYLIEEPEDGIHPMAIETVYQSLSSVYESHVLVATHSPTLLSCATPSEILCFAKDKHGATGVIAGDRHPRLVNWQSSADTKLLFSSEVFG